MKKLILILFFIIFLSSVHGNAVTTYDGVESGNYVTIEYETKKTYGEYFHFLLKIKNKTLYEVTLNVEMDDTILTLYHKENIAAKQNVSFQVHTETIRDSAYQKYVNLQEFTYTCIFRSKANSQATSYLDNISFTITIRHSYTRQFTIYGGVMLFLLIILIFLSIILKAKMKSKRGTIK